MAAGDTSEKAAPSAPQYSEPQRPSYVPYTGYQEYSQGFQPQAHSHREQHQQAATRREYWAEEAPPQPGYYVTSGHEYIPLSGEYGYDTPLPCCGCGIGWCLFIFGFFFNLLWYVGAILWFFPHNPRERPGLTANLVAACISAAFTLGIVAYFVNDREHIMALWASYQPGQPILDT